MSIPDAEARFQADVARLQAAKGIQVRAWFRENKTLVLVFLGYFVAVSIVAGVLVARGESPGPAILFAIFSTPVVALRVFLRWRVRRR
jgi:hypothetical protein